MSIQNLNSIEGVMDEIINLTKEKEEMSIIEWSPILKPWCNTLNEACKELKSFKPYTGKEFKSLKLGLVKEWMGLHEQIQGEVDYESITEAYENVEDKIDYNVKLTNNDVLIVLHFGLSILIERSNSNDYSEFYDLITIKEAINHFASNIVVGNKENLEPAQKGNLSKYVWAIIIKKNVEHIDNMIETLKTEFDLPDFKLTYSLIRQYSVAYKWKKILDSANINGFNKNTGFAQIPSLTRKKFIKSLEYAIGLFKNTDDSSHKLAVHYYEILNDYPIA